jgi:hypothetical protein
MERPVEPTAMCKHPKQPALRANRFQPDAMYAAQYNGFAYHM